MTAEQTPVEQVNPVQVNPVQKAAIEGRSILLFDGLCLMCNGVVRFLMDRDPAGQLLYTPLEGPLGLDLLARAGLPALASLPPEKSGIVLITKALTPLEKVAVRSDAAILVLGMLSGAWPLAGRLLAWTPRWLREWGYGLVARWRYRVFGKHDACPLPTPSERARILE